MPDVLVHFSDYFDVAPEDVRKYGAFNVSLVNDLPLFVDPFLLFNSQSETYQSLHTEMIDYLRFLRDCAERGVADQGLLREWFTFPEVAQNWLGFSKVGNAGHGLGMDFAKALHDNLHSVFTAFGDEDITRGSHLEKLTLIDSGVGRDKISDFTTNLIKRYLLDYTQEFAVRHVAPSLRRVVHVPRAYFSYDTQTWVAQEYDLPFAHNDYVVLTPRDILTRGDLWISRGTLLDDIELVLNAVPDGQLRARLNNYLERVLPKVPTREDRSKAVQRLIRAHPIVVDHFIRRQEDTGDRAVRRSEMAVAETQDLFVASVREIVDQLALTPFFSEPFPKTHAEAHRRIAFLKDVIENKGGHRIFWKGDQLVIRTEEDVHILYRLTWFGALADVSREVDDGRGPADFKISHGALDKTIVEFKLAKNKQLKRNLENQTDVYARASDADRAIKVIFFFSDSELVRVKGILEDIDLEGDPDIVLIDARRTNKPSGSKA